MTDINEAIAKMHAVQNGLRAAIEAACPAGKDHKPVQHSDRQSPWCESCRMTASGRKIEQARS